MFLDSPVKTLGNMLVDKTGKSRPHDQKSDNKIWPTYTRSRNTPGGVSVNCNPSLSSESREGQESSSWLPGVRWT